MVVSDEEGLGMAPVICFDGAEMESSEESRGAHFTGFASSVFPEEPI